MAGAGDGMTEMTGTGGIAAAGGVVPPTAVPLPAAGSDRAAQIPRTAGPTAVGTAAPTENGGGRKRITPEGRLHMSLGQQRRRARERSERAAS